jgi:hypothetical protein
MKIAQHAARRGGLRGGVRPRDAGWRASLDTRVRQQETTRVGATSRRLPPHQQ